MALRMVCCSLLRTGNDLGISHARGFATTGVLRRRASPLGPMPNEEIDCTDLESLEKYRSYLRYLKRAEEARNSPTWWKTYRQYLEKENPDPAADPQRVNIGLPYCAPSRIARARERKKEMKANRSNRELERSMRLREFKAPMSRVQEEWERITGLYQIQRLADHYAIYRDLFPRAYFLPQVILRVTYGDDVNGRVYHGNRLAAAQVSAAPQVSYEAEEGSLWTLLLTSPDEHLQDSEGEYVHWLVGNIPGNAVQSGQELCHYLPPFPAKGTGFHRFIYILFKQEVLINFKEDCRPSPCYCLKERTFKTVEFYRKQQDVMTPAGLAFFQSQWDESVTNTFHNVLNMKEPVFDLVRPPVYHPPQKVYPHGQPLRYLDRYRDGHVPTYGIY